MVGAFISSTGVDLHDYREAAVDTCLKLGIFPIAMEHFEAMGAGATAGSKRKLDEADLYVGIFAHRYGFIERPVHDRSVTEIEFDYAGERGLDRLCFLVDPSYPWPPDAIDYENHALLQAFKDRINKSLIRARFTTVDDFTAKLMHSLVKWIERSSSTPIVPDVSATVSGPALSIAPPRPTLVLGRESELADLKTRLGIRPDGHNLAKMRPLTLVRGWPGVGKTTLVTALGHDRDVTEAFPDGVLWAHLGENANPLFELAVWGRALNPLAATPRTLEEAIGQMRALLESQRWLLIVDDAWRSDDALPFKVGGPGCAIIFTTRFGDVARSLAVMPDDIGVLHVLSDDKAMELLSRLAPTVVRHYPSESLELVRDIEGLPLAIRVAGRLLEAEAAIDGDVTGLLTELRESRLLEADAPDDRFDPGTGTTPTIDLLLRRSTDRLDNETRDRFAYLGAFAPKPATFDLEAMKAVWRVSDALPTVRLLVDRGLLEPVIGLGRYQMHALLVMHARSLLT